jgi:hypothetical protein
MLVGFHKLNTEIELIFIYSFIYNYFLLKISLNIFVSIGNTAKLGTPIALSITRFGNPIIRRDLRRMLRSICRSFPCLVKRVRVVSEQSEDLTKSITDSYEE